MGKMINNNNELFDYIKGLKAWIAISGDHDQREVCYLLYLKIRGLQFPFSTDEFEGIVYSKSEPQPDGALLIKFNWDFVECFCPDFLSNLTTWFKENVGMDVAFSRLYLGFKTLSIPKDKVLLLKQALFAGTPFSVGQLSASPADMEAVEAPNQGGYARNASYFPDTLDSLPYLLQKGQPEPPVSPSAPAAGPDTLRQWNRGNNSDSNLQVSSATAKALEAAASKTAAGPSAPMATQGALPGYETLSAAAAKALEAAASALAAIPAWPAPRAPMSAQAETLPPPPYQTVAPAAAAEAADGSAAAAAEDWKATEISTTNGQAPAYAAVDPLSNLPPVGDMSNICSLETLAGLPTQIQVRPMPQIPSQKLPESDPQAGPAAPSAAASASSPAAAGMFSASGAGQNEPNLDEIIARLKAEGKVNTVTPQ